MRRIRPTQNLTTPAVEEGNPAHQWRLVVYSTVLQNWKESVLCGEGFKLTANLKLRTSNQSPQLPSITSPSVCDVWEIKTFQIAVYGPQKRGRFWTSEGPHWVSAPAKHVAKMYCIPIWFYVMPCIYTSLQFILAPPHSKRKICQVSSGISSKRLVKISNHWSPTKQMIDSFHLNIAMAQIRVPVRDLLAFWYHVYCNPPFDLDLKGSCLQIPWKVLANGHPTVEQPPDPNESGGLIKPYYQRLICGAKDESNRRTRKNTAGKTRPLDQFSRTTPYCRHSEHWVKKG